MALLPQKKTNAVKEKIRKKYEDMKRVLDEDLRITLTQLDTEHEATEKLVEDRIEDCYHLTQELDQELSNIGAKTQENDIQVHKRKFWFHATYGVYCLIMYSFYVVYRMLKEKKGMFTFNLQAPKPEFCTIN